MDDPLKSPAPPYPETLYHYTSTEALLSILNSIDKNGETFTLRATHGSYLNDLSEGALLPTALHQLGADESVMEILRDLSGYPFVLSFSEEGDDRFMWECYANQGKGATIGIKPDKLNDALPSFSGEDYRASLRKCEYTTVDDLVERYRGEGISEILKNENRTPLSRLLQEAYYYKYKDFEDEHEWRIFITSFPNGYRATDNGIVPYRELKIPVSALSSITFGPRCDFERNNFAVFRLLYDKIGLTRLNAIEIKRSPIPLR